MILLAMTKGSGTSISAGSCLGSACSTLTYIGANDITSPSINKLTSTLSQPWCDLFGHEI